VPYSVRAAALMLPLAIFPLQAQPIAVEDRDVWAHYLTYHETIRLPQSPANLTMLTFEVVVDPEGNVVSAKAVDGPADLRDRGVAIVKTWKYRPFEENGKHVAAKFKEYIRVVGPENLPKIHVPFPEIRDWNSVLITLERSPCFGRCPEYRVEIRGDGNVKYEGIRAVTVSGFRTDRISRKDVERIIEIARKADYFSLRPAYRANITDLPSITTSITIGGKRMTVLDYVGDQAGMPEGVSELESAIELAAKTYPLVNGPPKH